MQRKRNGPFLEHFVDAYRSIQELPLVKIRCGESFKLESSEQNYNSVQQQDLVDIEFGETAIFDIGNYFYGTTAESYDCKLWCII